jgi:hypothetical protein
MTGIFIKALMKGASKVSPTIKSVKPSKNIKEFTKHKEDVAKTTEKYNKGLTEEGKINVRKGTSRVLGKISNILKRKQLREKKMGGGMMGRRMGYSQGSKKGKIPTTPKEKSLAKLAPPKDRITFGDVVAGRTKGKRMQAKEGTGPEQFMRSGVKEDPMRDQMKQPLKLKRSKALMLEDLKKSKFKKRKP